MKLLKKELLVLIFITFFWLIYTVLYPNIIVYDSEIELNSKYNSDINAYNLFVNLTDKVKVDNDNINTSTIGEYKVTYSIKYLFYNIKKTVTVKVVDKEKPSITLKGDNPAYSCPNKDYEEEGFEAIDNYDGDISDKVIINKVDNSIFYKVSDKSGNKFEIERKVIFEDKENPVINLKGSSSITLYVGNNYGEPGYTASDNCDGDITNNVVSTGTVDTSKVGEYKITYSAQDSSGNKTNVERIIKVINRPVYQSSGNGVIYLTFDDGPSYLTGQILDILDEEGVKATFFVCGANEYTRRAYNSGHTIALHSASHNYSYIYANSNNYFNDLNNISNTVYNTIGIYPKIIRFPGGSSNTVSKKYNNGIMTYLTSEVVNRGYTYFDWNVDSNDAGGDIYNSSNIYYNVMNNVSHNKTNVVLMHDSSSHTATVKALRDIIRYGKQYGYSFKAITSDTPVVRHSVNN